MLIDNEGRAAPRAQCRCKRSKDELHYSRNGWFKRCLAQVSVFSVLCIYLSGVHSGADDASVDWYWSRCAVSGTSQTNATSRRAANSWLRASCFVRVHNTTIQEAHDTIFKMASMNFSSGKQFVKPPQRGIFPLDHDAECKPKMQVSSMVVWRCDDVNLESDEVLLRCAG